MKAFLLLLISTSIFAHDNWVRLDKYKVEVGEKTVAIVGGGHSFLKSEKRVPKRLIHRFEVVAPDGKRVQLKPIEDGYEWKASFIPRAKGLHVINLEFRRPGMDQSLLLAKSFLDVGLKSEETKVLNNDLEIVLKGEGRSDIAVYSKGKQISSRVAINSKEGVAYVRTGKKRAGKLDLKKGIYMLTTSKKGQQASLTFEVY